MSAEGAVNIIKAEDFGHGWWITDIEHWGTIPPRIWCTPCDAADGEECDNPEHRPVSDLSEFTHQQRPFRVVVAQSSKDACDHKVIERDTQWEDHERTCPVEHRISIVPGMVLQIRDSGRPDTGVAHIRDDGAGYSRLRNRYIQMPARGMGEYVVLPAGAAPDRWAVKIKKALYGN